VHEASDNATSPRIIASRATTTVNDRGGDARSFAIFLFTVFARSLAGLTKSLAVSQRRTTWLPDPLARSFALSFRAHPHFDVASVCVWTYARTCRAARRWHPKLTPRALRFFCAEHEGEIIPMAIAMLVIAATGLSRRRLHDTSPIF
jgi:hypothetical protein